MATFTFSISELRVDFVLVWWCNLATVVFAERFAEILQIVNIIVVYSRLYLRRVFVNSCTYPVQCDSDFDVREMTFKVYLRHYVIALFCSVCEL